VDVLLEGLLGRPVRTSSVIAAPPSIGRWIGSLFVPCPGAGSLIRRRRSARRLRPVDRKLGSRFGLISPPTSCPSRNCLARQEGP
jgi:hypothetical protein